VNLGKKEEVKTFDTSWDRCFGTNGGCQAQIYSRPYRERAHCCCL
jgi:hypothetical protein